MKRVYSNESAAMAWHIRNVLEHHGIAAQVRNDRLYSVAGEVPIHECMAEVWINNPLDERLAEKLIAENLGSAEVEGPDWHCPECGETNTANFAACFACGYLVDGGED